jgi:hypothetical protein
MPTSEACFHERVMFGRINLDAHFVVRQFATEQFGNVMAAVVFQEKVSA